MDERYIVAKGKEKKTNIVIMDMDGQAENKIAKKILFLPFNFYFYKSVR